MPIELLDRLRALTHNMDWLDEGSEEQAAFVADGLADIMLDMYKVCHDKYGCMPAELRRRWSHTLDNF